MSLPQETLDEIRAAAYKYARERGSLNSRCTDILHAHQAGAIPYAEKLEAMMKERDEVKEDAMKYRDLCE